MAVSYTHLDVYKRQQQLCRWLLLSLDQLPGNEIDITQELIAGMLGVRREAVTEAAGKLQAAGPVSYTHLDVYKRQLQFPGIGGVARDQQNTICDR